MKAKSKELLKQIKNLSSEQIEHLKASVSSIDSEHTSSIAITGIAFNFPGNIRDLESFWQLLKKGKHCIQDLNINARFSNHKKDVNDKNYWGGFLEEGVEEFDPAFFQISPKEAEIMDPQHRLLLQAVWHALEDAAYLPEKLSNSRTGVYIGVCTYDYADLISTQSLNSAHAALGKAPSLLANRVSYFFNWHGPSETIDTACSSSFVALHRAVEDLRRGECHQAIVGGVNLLLSSRLFESFSDAGMLSPNGHCRPLDAQANGYVRGEGVVAIVLKPLVEALRDKERIYGIIRGTAVNHGGKANSLTAPN
nr:polyketide synthase [Alphaproteobacteria bacterium]